MTELAAVPPPARPDPAVAGWLRCFQPRPSARHRLVCLPHAGGAATFYRRWSAHLPGQFEVQAVQYPGREERYREPLVTDLTRLAESVADALTGLRDRPLALFGHSMGAYIAYEAARRLQRRGNAPAHLFVSGQPPPHHHRPGEVHRKGDEGLVAELRRLGGTRDGLLDDPELRELVLPVMRADYQAIETYHPQPGPPLGCPITALTAIDDPEVSMVEMRDWATYTTGDFTLRSMTGGHFYLVAKLPEVARVVAARTGPPGWTELP